MKLTLKIFSLFIGLGLCLCTSVSYAAFPVKKNVTKHEIVQTMDVSQHAGADAATPTDSGKSQLVALLLVILVGTLGIHRFYLGYTGIGIIQLLTLGVFGIWTLVDLVMIITGDLQPKDGTYSETL